MGAGDFTIPDASTSPTDLTTLFGVAQGVGDTPVVLKPGAGGKATPPVRVPGGGLLQKLGQALTPSTTGGTPAQTQTLVQVLQSFYATDTPTLTSIQRQLYAGGFYPSSYYSATNPKAPQFGSADDDSFAAFKSAAVQAARSGKPLTDVINQAITAASASGLGGVGTPKPKPIVQPPSPVDIYSQIEESQKTKFGHGVISRKQIESIITDYQTLVTTQRERLQQAQIDNTAATVPQVPNLQPYVEQRLAQAAPKEVALNDSLHAANLVMGLFGGGGSNG